MSFTSIHYPRNAPLSQAQRGFTLVELMVTIAIMAILISIAAPNFVEKLAKQKLNESTSALVQALKNAKAESVIQNDTITVTYSATDKSITTTRSDASILGLDSLKDNADVTMTTPKSDNKVQFTKSKTATKTTIKICDKNGTTSGGSQIEVSPTAVISVKGVTC